LKILLIPILILVFSHSIQAQKPVGEITTDLIVKDIQGMAIDHGIFINVSLVDPETRAAPEKKSYRIHDNGTLDEVNLGIIKDEQLVAIAKSGDSIYNYYLDEDRKKVTIRAWELSNQNGAGKIGAQQISLSGTLYGSYSERGDLFLLCSSKGSFALRLMQIRGMQVVKETSFSLSFDLGRNKKSTVSFIQAWQTETFLQAASLIKLTKEGDVIWITVDEPMSTYEEKTSQSALSKTTVVRLDLMTGDADVKTFYDPTREYFNSSISTGLLFKVVRDNGLRIDVFNFEDERKIYTVAIPARVDYSGDIAYVRLGYNFVSKETILGPILGSRWPHFVMVDSTATGEWILTLGNYGKEDGGIPVVTGYGLVFEMISLAAIGIQQFEAASVYQYFYLKGSLKNGFNLMQKSTIGMQQLKDDAYIYQYLDFKGSPGNRFGLTNESSLIRQRVDDYEYAQQLKKVVFSYKGYVNSQSGIYGIYQMAKSSVIQILKFEK
jgi:hypothetical protein